MKILIVDDSAGWRNHNLSLVSSILKDADIQVSDCATDAYSKIFENNNSPYDIIITDMQMENDFEPLYAGEWLIERLQELKNYYKTKIVIVSATYNIQQVANNYGVEFIPKSKACNNPDAFKKVLIDN